MMSLDDFNTSSSSGGGKSGKYSDEELLNALREFYNENGDFTSEQYQEEVSSPSYSTIQRRFETFNQAKIKAGIPVTRSGGKQLGVSQDMKHPSEDKAFIVGCLLTDGWIHTSDTSNHVGFQVKDKELAQEFALCLSSWAGLRWNGWNSNKTEMEARGPIEKENGESNWRVKKGSKELAQYLKTYEDLTAEVIKDELSEYKSTLLSSIWDCEGSITESGQIRFANSDPELLKLYMLLVEDLVGVEFIYEWKWASRDKKYRKYGDFTLSPKVADSDTRNVIITSEYRKPFAKAVNSMVNRKDERLQKWA